MLSTGLGEICVPVCVCVCVFWDRFFVVVLRWIFVFVVILFPPPVGSLWRIFRRFWRVDTVKQEFDHG